MERERDFIGLKRVRVEVEKAPAEERCKASGLHFLQDISNMNINCKGGSVNESSSCSSSSVGNGLHLSLGPAAAAAPPPEDCEKVPCVSAVETPSLSRAASFKGFRSDSCLFEGDNGNKDSSTIAAAGACSLGEFNLELEPNAAAKRRFWNKFSSAPKLMPFKVLEDEKVHKRKLDQMLSTNLQPAAYGYVFKSDHANLPAFQKNFNETLFKKESEEASNGRSSVPVQHFGVPVGIVASPVFDQYNRSCHSAKNGVAYALEKNAAATSNTKEFFNFNFAASSKGQDATTSSQGNAQQNGAFSRPTFVSLPSVEKQNRNEHLFGNQDGNQLTIFYAGTVNVYENIPPEKAQTVMLLANSFSEKKQVSSNQKIFQSPQIPASTSTKEQQSRPATPVVGSILRNKLISTVPRVQSSENPYIPNAHFKYCSHPLNFELSPQSRGDTPTSLGISPAPEHVKFKRNGLNLEKTQHSLEKQHMPNVPENIQAVYRPEQSENLSSTKIEDRANQRTTTSCEEDNTKQSAYVYKPSPVLPRAVPQARKASLARFLEKRKERVPPNVPCSTEISPNESSLDAAKTSTTCISSSRECKSPQHDVAKQVMDTKISESR